MMYPVRPAKIAIQNVSTPRIQVNPRPPRHAAVKNEAPKCTNMVKKKTCTPQKWSELRNNPVAEVCHQ